MSKSFSKMSLKMGIGVSFCSLSEMESEVFSVLTSAKADVPVSTKVDILNMESTRRVVAVWGDTEHFVQGLVGVGGLL